jgi:hypothetical protein
VSKKYPANTARNSQNIRYSGTRQAAVPRDPDQTQEQACVSRSNQHHVADAESGANEEVMQMVAGLARNGDWPNQIRRSMTPTVSISGSANSHKAVTGVIAACSFSPPCDIADQQPGKQETQQHAAIVTKEDACATVARVAQVVIEETC